LQSFRKNAIFTSVDRLPFYESNPLMPVPSPFGFYAILTNPLRGYEYCTHVLVDAEVPFVQLRIKDLPESAILPTALKMRRITRGTGTKLIINDYPEVARACQADGVHIGQDDMNVTDARSLLGPDALVGLSTHTPGQTTAACALHPDYIGIGPVYPTPTKKNHDPVIGIEGMKAMLAAATVPAVVIGGIDLTNIDEVLEAGAVNFCMVRQFTQSTEPEKTVAEIMRVWRGYCRRESPGNLPA
jgi:thiamine-phosphate pyrophosphorylase